MYTGVFPGHSVYVLVPFDSMVIKFAMVTHLGMGIFVINLKKTVVYLRLIT